MNHTPEQEGFIAELLAGASSIALEAVAGSGKTSTLKAGAAKALSTGKLPHRTLAVAFNKRNKEEMERAFPSSIKCQTLNGLGFGAWIRFTGKRFSDITIDESKFWRHAKKVVPQDILDECGSELRSLVNIARHAEVIPRGSPGTPQRDADELWLDFISDHELEFAQVKKESAVEFARLILAEMNKSGFAGIIDFDDQIYLPVVYGAGFNKYDLVIGDEFQDFSPSNHKMLRRSLNIGGRFIGAGDRFQSIYAFRGASAASCDELSALFSCVELPLTVSFRCPQSVVAEAQSIVPHMRAWAQAPEGIVGSSKAEDIRPGDAVLARYNRPLIGLAFSLIKRGIAPKILGRDIGASLAKIIRRSPEASLSGMKRWIAQWSEGEIEEAKMKNQYSKIARIIDKRDALAIFLANAGESATPERVARNIEILFSDAEGQVTLSTIHKAKGAEWPRVHFVGREDLPPRWAKGSDAQQELNAIYVGVTRAQRELYFMPDEGKPSKSPLPAMDLGASI